MPSVYFLSLIVVLSTDRPKMVLLVLTFVMLCNIYNLCVFSLHVTSCLNSSIGITSECSFPLYHENTTISF